MFCRRLCCAWIVLTAMILPAALFAQRTTATISGTLTDQTGAIVPGADVSATETATGATTHAPANSDGFYVLSSLSAGTYTVKVEKQGFQNSVHEGVVVQVNRPVTLNFTLQIGTATQTVTVAA